jgi:hypothetical protein
MQVGVLNFPTDYGTNITEPARYAPLAAAG